MEGVDRPNRSVFDAPGVVADYEGSVHLTPCETILFDRHVPPGARVLDLGVGTGRTTPFLVARSASYVGVDYAASMVAAARRLHPGVQIREGDATDLAEFGDGSMDVIVFSYNGIDYLSDADRDRCFDACRRILSAGGIFIFSTHNPRAILPATLPRNRSRVRRWGIATYVTCRRMMRLVPKRSFWRGEGRVIDPVRGGLDTHMATPRRSVAALRRHGFEVLEVLNGDHPRRPAMLQTPWWYFVCASPGP